MADSLLGVATKLKFRLSTLLLLVLVAAVALGWFADRQNRNRRELLGEWYYPASDVAVVGYTSLLEFRDDGTFTKIQGYRVGDKTYEGTFDYCDDGAILFHVTKVTESASLAFTRNGEPVITNVECDCRCRCAVDPTGFLIIDARSFGDEIGINWEAHARDTNYVIRGRD